VNISSLHQRLEHLPCQGGQSFSDAAQSAVRFFLLLAFVCLFSLPALAQGTSASIRGVISDPSGAVLPGVMVAAQNTDTTLKQTTTTSSSGLYSLAPLPPGNYQITAVFKGFQTYTQLTTLTVGQAAALNFTLQVGQASQSITVDTGQILLNATNAEISNVIDQASITQLPLNGRDPARAYRHIHFRICVVVVSVDGWGVCVMS
jgi:hypothetical protein